jgi:hypothetical protein
MSASEFSLTTFIGSLSSRCSATVKRQRARFTRVKSRQVFMAAEQPSFFIKSALGSRSRMMASQNAALSLLSGQARYGIKPGTTIVRIVDGTEEVVLADNALLIAMMRWRTKNPGRS